MSQDRAPVRTQPRAAEIEDCLSRIQPLILDFVCRAEDASFSPSKTPEHAASTNGRRSNALLHYEDPEALSSRGYLHMPHDGRGVDGLIETVRAILESSTNTWHQGFMNKLYASTNAVGVASELVLAVLNTNVHVYKVSPALSVIEKHVSKDLANLFSLHGQHAGGMAQSGGSAANMTALVVARNYTFPDTKTSGNMQRPLVLFTSAHAHYSLEKAATICGLGSSALWKVGVDSHGRMIASQLLHDLQKARSMGLVPFFVNATAGTTVLGSFDPLPEIAAICNREKLWLHIDASWGGPVVFSPSLSQRVRGSHLADSITISPHKMLGVPITCSFLLARDLRIFWKSNTLPADYLFHDAKGQASSTSDASMYNSEAWDLADLTLQCGRKGDALKFAMAWIFFGSSGYQRRIEHAFCVANNMAARIMEHPDLVLVGEYPPPCLQVCFFYAPGGGLGDKGRNSKRTRAIADRLLEREFLIDFASSEDGAFLRVVVSLETQPETAECLLRAIEDIGREQVAQTRVRAE